MTCEDFEIAVEMRRHGALGEEGSRALDAHLATCASCRAFENLSKETKDVMTNQVSGQLATTDWDALSQHTKTFIAKYGRQRLVFAAGMFALMTPASMLLDHDPRGMFLNMSMCAVACLLVLRLVGWRKERALAKNGVGRSLLKAYRLELEYVFRSSKRSAGMMPAFMAILARIIVPQIHTLRAWIGFGAMMAIFAGSAAYVWFVRRPQIAREIALLDRDLG